MHLLTQNPGLFVVVLVVILLLVSLYYILKPKRQLKPLPTQDSTPTVEQLTKTLETPQQGEEEIQQVLPQGIDNTVYGAVTGSGEGLTYQETKVDDTTDSQVYRDENSNITAVSRRMSSQEVETILQHFLENQGKKPELSLEEKLAFTYYFHSKDFTNANRYSAAGRFVKLEDDTYELHIAYSVVSEEDKNIFSRAKGRELAVAKLDNPNGDWIHIPVPQDELEYPGKFFGSIAKSVVPYSVLSPKDRTFYHHYDSNFKNYTKTQETTVEEDTEYKEYLAKMRKTPHRLLTANVDVEHCEFCSSYSLVVTGTNVMVDDEKVEDTKIEQDSTQETPLIVALPEGDTEFTNEEQAVS